MLNFRRFELVEKNENNVVFKLGLGKIVMEVFPFKLKAFYNDELVVAANDLGRFEFEHFRYRPESMYV